MSNDITITFDDIIKQYRTLDLSEDIFRSMMAEDSNWRPIIKNGAIRWVFQKERGSLITMKNI